MVHVEITGSTLRVNGKFRGQTSKGYSFKHKVMGGDDMIIIVNENVKGLGIVASLVFADDLCKPIIVDGDKS